MVRSSYFDEFASVDDKDIYRVLEQYTELDFNSASSQNKQSL